MINMLVDLKANTQITNMTLLSLCGSLQSIVPVHMAASITPH